MEETICFEKMYFLLFNKISDALKALEKYNYGEAADVLRQAQMETEEAYLNHKIPTGSFQA